jgi:hypothetical protein
MAAAAAQVNQPDPRNAAPIFQVEVTKRGSPRGIAASEAPLPYFGATLVVRG